jgi:hypothetical protein
MPGFQNMPADPRDRPVLVRRPWRDDGLKAFVSARRVFGAHSVWTGGVNAVKWPVVARSRSCSQSSEARNPGTRLFLRG